MASVVARVAESDAVEAVYRQEGDRLWRALYAFAGNEDVASDAVAEAFAQALRRGAEVRDVRRWVWRSAFRIAAGDLQRESKLRHGPLPDVATDHPEADEQLLDALQQLTPQQRMAIVLHYYADFPVSEIAHRTGMNQIAVRAHLSRGRKRIRAVLGEDR